MPGKIDKDLNININYFNTALMVGKSFDMMQRDLEFGGRKACLYYVNGLINSEQLQLLMMHLVELKEDQIPMEPYDLIQRAIPFSAVEKISDRDQIITNILSGVVILMVEGYDEAFKIDCRSYPSRSVAEPEKDKVLRGSKDGFVETVISNTALIRRRIRSPELIIKILQVGDTSKTDIAVCYMEGRAHQPLLDRLLNQLQNMKIDSLTMNRESLAECLYTRRWLNPFPKFKYSERPDTSAACILEGSIVILVDNSPSAMIIPSSIFDIIEEADDYYFPPITGTYMRFSRFFINIISIVLIPLFILFMNNPEYIPKGFEFIKVKEQMNISLVWQFLILEFAIDGLRLAAISTPNMLTTPLSLIAGIAIGEYAVSSGWFNSEAMLYMAFVAIANFTQSSFELSYALKFMRLTTIILTGIFNLWGFIGGIVLSFLSIALNKTYAGTSYIYPLIPFDGKKLLRRFFRVSLPKSENQQSK